MKPPKSPIEVTIKIGVESIDDLIHVMENEIREWRTHQNVYSHFWGGAGTHGDVTVVKRNISPKQYREELAEWFKDEKAEKNCEHDWAPIDTFGEGAKKMCLKCGKEEKSEWG